MRIASLLFRAARVAADAEAIERTVETGSPRPIARRIINKLIGRNVVSRLWFK